MPVTSNVAPLYTRHARALEPVFERWIRDRERLAIGQLYGRPPCERFARHTSASAVALAFASGAAS